MWVFYKSKDCSILHQNVRCYEARTVTNSLLDVCPTDYVFSKKY